MTQAITANMISQLGWTATSIGPSRKRTIPRDGTRGGIGTTWYPRRTGTITAMPEQITKTLPALKEWALVCERLLAGTQAVMLRKGGIDEKGFWVEADEFLLYPTYFHQMT